MKKLFPKALYWLPAILYMGLIFYLSSFPPPQAAREVPVFFDIKVIHILEYGMLNLLVFWGLDKTSDIPFIWKAVYSVGITLIYGLTDELHQVFVPGRSGKLIDIAANLIGCIMVQCGIFAFRVKSRRDIADI